MILIFDSHVEAAFFTKCGFIIQLNTQGFLSTALSFNMYYR